MRHERRRASRPIDGQPAIHDEAETGYRLGLEAWRAGDGPRALRHITTALQLRPDHAQAWSDLGAMQLALGRIDEAVEACRRAIGLQADHAAAWSNLGNGLKQLGDGAAAIAAYHEALRHRPDFPAALVNLGDALLRQDRVLDAESASARALALAPGLVEARRLAGRLALRRGDDAAALAAYGAAVDLDPDRVTSWIELGRLHQARGSHASAEAAFRTALRLAPLSADAACNLAGVLLSAGLFAEAADVASAVIAREPGAAEAHANLAGALRHLGRLDEALASARRASALDPGLGAALALEICDLRASLCDWDGLEADLALALRQDPTRGPAVPPFPLLHLVDSPADHLRFARAFAARLTARVTPPARRRPAAPQGRRLRIGYVSSDFHAHATASLVAGLFEAHDRGHFEIFGYSCGPDDGSAMRRRLMAGLDHWIDLREAAHETASQRIAADAIDVLVDLKGYTRDSRPAILALRPAPIQVAYLGYPGSLGADFVDYALVDPIVVPEDRHRFYDEKLVHLPHCYQPNDVARTIAATGPSRADCGLPPQGFVFCCFNAGHKIGPVMFDLWMRLLADIPDAVLWLLEPEAGAKANLMRAAAGRPIDPARLIFAPRIPLADHLARLRLADLFLDTLPYNAHTTGSEALWAGLPLLTCMGEAFAGRVGASLLAAVGLPELVARSLDDYAAAAAFLARNPAVLGALRQRLAQNRATAPLFDTRGSTRALEAAYRHMVTIAAAGEAPRGFSIAP